MHMATVEHLEEVIEMLGKRIDHICPIVERLDKPDIALTNDQGVKLLADIVLNQQIIMVGLQILVRRQRDHARQLGE